MKKDKKKAIRGLRTQIALFYVIASFLMVTLTGFIIYFTISNVILHEKLDSTKMAVDKSGTYIGSYVDKIKDLSYIIAKNPSTIRYLSVESPDNKDQLTNALDKENIMNMIETTIASDTSIESIVIVGKKGQLLSNESSLDMSMSEDMMMEEWYVEAINADEMPVLTSARMQKFSMDKDHWVISLSRELVGNGGENIGVMVMDLKYSVLEDYLKDLNLGQDGDAFILNQDNEVVYHKNTAYFVDEQLYAKLLEETTMAQGYDAKTNLLYHEYKIENTNWTLSGVASLDGLLIIRRQLIEIILVVTLISFIFMMSMVRKIRQLMSNVSEQEKELKTYELNVLHSQINPHFLYNTLDTIVWMAEFGDSDKVVKLTQSLARFFRLSLSGGSETTSIINEIEHVKQYLTIQEERYKNKLTYDFSVDQALEETIIPKMILQPIVENAIYHGIRELEEIGEIHITVEQDGEDIVMIVKDNGVGFDGSMSTKARTDNEAKLGGVGIDNVDKRLKLAYGDAYGVEVETSLGMGTTVILRVGNQMKTGYNKQ